MPSFGDYTIPTFDWQNTGFTGFDSNFGITEPTISFSDWDSSVLIPTFSSFDGTLPNIVLPTFDYSLPTLGTLPWSAFDFSGVIPQWTAGTHTIVISGQTIVYGAPGWNSKMSSLISGFTNMKDVTLTIDGHMTTIPGFSGGYPTLTLPIIDASLLLPSISKGTHTFVIGSSTITIGKPGWLTQWSLIQPTLATISTFTFDGQISTIPGRPHTTSTISGSIITPVTSSTQSSAIITGSLITDTFWPTDTTFGLDTTFDLDTLPIISSFEFSSFNTDFLTFTLPPTQSTYTFVNPTITGTVSSVTFSTQSVFTLTTDSILQSSVTYTIGPSGIVGTIIPPSANAQLIGPGITKPIVITSTPGGIVTHTTTTDISGKARK